MLWLVSGHYTAVQDENCSESPDTDSDQMIRFLAPVQSAESGVSNQAVNTAGEYTSVSKFPALV